MENFVTVVMEKQETKALDESAFPLYETFNTEQDTTVIEIPLPRELDESESSDYANRLADYLFSEGYEDFDIYIGGDEEIDEVTFDDDDDFFEEYGVMWYNEDDVVDEAEYKGRKVKLGKPMQGDVKKFKVYVKNPKGNVVKVNFGHGGSSVKGKAMRIRKNNAARRRSFRARHNCDNPGPRHKARYWSCRKW
jgi:hypothetical protein|tara:strand:+ start:15460 stop:16038 length:579 start_codon:yes stop_codon:yes gene_type:complete